jgi:protein FAM32A
MTKTSFLGGSLSFKGDKKKKSAKKTSKQSKHALKDEEAEVAKHFHSSNADNVENSDDDEELTESERKAIKLKRQRQKEESKIIASKSHRERVEELNVKLGNLTEHNDIPRVSAAGNG